MKDQGIVCPRLSEPSAGKTPGLIVLIGPGEMGCKKWVKNS
jgi:hypothetical protein